MRVASVAMAAMLVLGAGSAARAQTPVSVVYAGSMGAVMDRGVAPAFSAKTGDAVQGEGQGAYGLARLITAKSINPDVFVSISPGPIKLVQAAHLAGPATPIATTQVVLAYAPHAPAAAAIKADWVKALQAPGVTFGRTDPATDPLGQYSLFALQLAGLYYKAPGLAQKVAGDPENSSQIFEETSILARLQAGQMDAAFGYESQVISQHLPFITLPDQINFSDPAFDRSWYGKAGITLSVKGKTTTAHPGPLVYYAVVLKNAKHPAAAKAFIAFLRSPQGQAILAKYGYNPPKGGDI